MPGLGEVWRHDLLKIPDSGGPLAVAQGLAADGVHLLRGEAVGAAAHGGEVFHMADPGQGAHRLGHRPGGPVAPAAAAVAVAHPQVLLPLGGDPAVDAVAEGEGAGIGVKAVTPRLPVRQGQLVLALPSAPSSG